MKQNGRKFFLTDDKIQLLLEVCNEYKAEREKPIQQHPKNLTDGFPNSENAEQSLTVKRIAGKLKTIRTNFKKAVDTNKRSGGGRVVLTF